MKRSKKVLALVVASCLCLPVFTGCSSRLVEQANIYFNSIQTVLDNLNKYNEAINGGSEKRENALDTPSITIENGKYSFAKVDNASYYVVSVYETSGSLEAVGSVTVQEDGSAAYNGSMTDLKAEYSYQDWFVRVVAHPAEGGTLEASDAGFATYTVKGEVSNGTISSKYVWNVNNGEVALTLNGFDYQRTAYPTNVKVTLTNKSTNAKVSVDTGKVTASSVSIEATLPVSTADYSVSLDCQWDETYVTNPTWTTTANDISVDATRSIISDGMSYTCDLFNQFEFPFVYEGFKLSDIPTDKAYADVALEDGIVFGTSNARNNECTFRAYPLWGEKEYKAKAGAIHSFDVRIKGSSAITATPKKSPGSASTNIIFGQLDFFENNKFELELEYQYIRTDGMNDGVYYVPGVICEGYYHIEEDGTYTLSYDYSNAYETAYEPVQEKTGRASFYSEIDPNWSNSGGNQGGGGNPGGGFPGGGDQGGGGNPGGGNMSISVVSVPTFAEGAAEMITNINFMNNDKAAVCTLKATPTEGSTYSYTLSTTGAMGEAVTGTVELKADGTVTIHVDGFGPFGAADASGTWTVADGQITVTIA